MDDGNAGQNGDDKNNWHQNYGNAKRFKTDNNCTCSNTSETQINSACTSESTATPINNTNNNLVDTVVTPSSPVSNSVTEDEDLSSYDYLNLIHRLRSNRSTIENPLVLSDENESIHHHREEDNILDSSDLDSLSTILEDTDLEESDVEEPAVLKKEKPKPKWITIPELINRQIGTTIKKQNPALFQQRCYSSLHCVRRLDLVKKFQHHRGCVNSLNFHHQGDLLASGSDDYQCVIWDWKKGVPLTSFHTKHKGNVFQTKFLPLSGDLHVVTSARDGLVRLAQISAQEGLRCTRKLGSHNGACHKLAVLYDQPHIVLSCGEDGFVLSHDVRKNKPENLAIVKDDQMRRALYSISSHPLKSHEFCVGGRDHFVRTYDIRKCGDNCLPLNKYYPNHLNTNGRLNVHVTCATYNYNGTEILASYNDEDIYIFDTNGESNSFVHQYQGHRNGATIKGVNYFGPKSEFIVSGSDCGHIFFWEKNTEAIVNLIKADDNGVVNVLEPHPSYPFMCTSGLDWDIKLLMPIRNQDSPMKGISNTIKKNKKARNTWAGASDINDGQMIWMLWQQLRNTARQRHTDDDVLDFSTSSSFSTSLTDSDDSSDSSSRCATS